MFAEATITQLLVGTLAPQPQQDFYASQVSAYTSPESRIASRLLALSSVESVYIDRSDEITRVWTIIDEDSDSLADAIYDQEKLLIQELNPQRLDFHVVARNGRHLRSLLTLNYPFWIRR